MRTRILVFLMLASLAASGFAVPSSLLAGSSGWSQGLIGFQYDPIRGTSAVGGAMVWNQDNQWSLGFGLQYRFSGAKDDFPVVPYMDVRLSPFSLPQSSFALPLLVRVGADLGDTEGALWLDAGLAADWFPLAFSEDLSLMTEVLAAGRVSFLTNLHQTKFSFVGGFGLGTAWPENSSGAYVYYY